MKKYKLLKDLPNIKAGTTRFRNEMNKYACVDKHDETAYLNHKLVENNPEWFEEVKEVEPSPEYVYINGKKYFVKKKSGDKSNPTRMVLTEVKDVEPSVYVLCNEVLIRGEGRDYRFSKKDLFRIIKAGETIHWSDKDMIFFGLEVINELMSMTSEGVNVEQQFEKLKNSRKPK
jgi:hypothetical protein